MSQVDRIEQLAAAIHAAGRPMALAVTGGGSRAVADLLGVPGASRTVLEAVVPYSSASLIDWLGGRPDQFCAERTARAMAMRAFLRAAALLRAEGRDAGRAAGLGCTASLASDRQKRGPHRIHLALQTADETVAQTVELQKGARSRSGEESVAGTLLLNLAAEAAGCELLLDPGLLPGEVLRRRRCAPPEMWRSLLRGDSLLARQGPDPGTAARLLVFPGAFDPRHEGHREMARIAREALGTPVIHELSIANVDKPPLDFLEIESRGAQFSPEEPLLLTRAPTFVEKARLLPGATFVVGADTMRRIGDPRYYGGSPAARDAALAEMAASGVRFLVFGRAAQGRFQALDDLDLPPALRALCESVPERQFRRDISSTELRRAAGSAE